MSIVVAFKDLVLSDLQSRTHRCSVYYEFEFEFEFLTETKITRGLLDKLI